LFHALPTYFGYLKKSANKNIVKKHINLLLEKIETIKILADKERITSRNGYVSTKVEAVPTRYLVDMTSSTFCKTSEDNDQKSKRKRSARTHSPSSAAKKAKYSNAGIGNESYETSFLFLLFFLFLSLETLGCFFIKFNFVPCQIMYD
jgi:hypothetical protein